MAPPNEVERCFNCWESSHTSRCPMPTISVREREALRVRKHIPYPVRNARKYYEMLYIALGCTNCWNSIEHRWDTCPEPKLSVVDAERLRYKMGMPLHGEWKRILDENGVSSTIVGDVVLVVREGDDDSDNPGPVVQKITPAVAVALGGGARRPSGLPQTSSETRIPPSSSVSCWNCWTAGHTRATCPQPTSPFPETDMLRRRLGIPKPNNPKYEELLAFHHCWNCWDANHKGKDCPHGYLTFVQKEMFRVQKGVPMFREWKDQLDKFGVREMNMRKEAKEKWDREMDSGFGITQAARSGVGKKGTKRRTEDGRRQMDPRWEKENLWTGAGGADKVWQQLATGGGGGEAALMPPPQVPQKKESKVRARGDKANKQGGNEGSEIPDPINFEIPPIVSSPHLPPPPPTPPPSPHATANPTGTDLVHKVTAVVPTTAVKTITTTNINNNNNNNNNCNTVSIGGGASSSRINNSKGNNNLNMVLSGALEDLRGLRSVLAAVYAELED